jgi:hypothetical protein
MSKYQKQSKVRGRRNQSQRTRDYQRKNPDAIPMLNVANNFLKRLCLGGH